MWDREERLLNVIVFFSICTALFHLSLTSKFALSFQKVLVRGCVGERDRRKTEGESLGYHINYCFTQSQGTVDSRVTAERNSVEKNKSQIKSFSSVCSCGFAVKNKPKHSDLVGRCAVSCGLIRLCLNSENTEQLRNCWRRETVTHTHGLHLKVSLWATHFSSSMWSPRCWNMAAKNEH